MELVKTLELKPFANTVYNLLLGSSLLKKIPAEFPRRFVLVEFIAKFTQQAIHKTVSKQLGNENTL